MANEDKVIFMERDMHPGPNDHDIANLVTDLLPTIQSNGPVSVRDDVDRDVVLYCTKRYGSYRFSNQGTNHVRFRVWRLKPRRDFTSADISSEINIPYLAGGTAVTDGMAVSDSDAVNPSLWSWGYSPYDFPRFKEWFKISLKKGWTHVSPGRTKEFWYKEKGYRFNFFDYRDNFSTIRVPRISIYYMFEVMGDCGMYSASATPSNPPDFLAPTGHFYVACVSQHWHKLYVKDQGQYTATLDLGGVYDQDWITTNQSKQILPNFLVNAGVIGADP